MAAPTSAGVPVNNSIKDEGGTNLLPKREKLKTHAYSHMQSV